MAHLTLPNVIEKFCFMSFNTYKFIVVANANLLTLVRICTDSGAGSDHPYQLQLLQSIHAFQKPIMTVDYDFCRKRVMAGGLDQ